MQSVGATFFACEDPAFDITGLSFEIEDGVAVRAWAGGVEYLANPSGAYTPVSEELKSLEGLYDDDDRWGVPTRVYARGESLFLTNANYTETLTRRDDGDWNVSDDARSAEWIRFDKVINGKPQRIIGSGNVQLRRFS